MEPDPLAALGIKLSHLIAGLAGGSVRYLLAGGSWFSAVASVVIGSLTAAYLTVPVYSLLMSYAPGSPSQPAEHATGFLVGLTAMVLCEGVMKRARAWSVKTE